MTDEKCTQLQYDQIAVEYHQKRLQPETSLFNDHLDQPLIEKLLLQTQLVKQKNILDLGCGSGLLTKKILTWGAQSVEGLDLSTELLIIAKRENPEIEFKHGSVTCLPYPAGRFDIIVSALVMHYVSDLMPFFSEAHRTLKDGGFFVFTFHHPVMEVISHGQDGFAKLAPTYFDEVAYEWEMSQGSVLKSFHHTFESILKTLSNCGFQFQELLEARAPESLRECHPEFYGRARFFPTFAGIRAKKL